jgi:hypothetical protein
VNLQVGQALVSAIDSTSVIVIRVGDEVTSVTCGGAEMLDAREHDGGAGDAAISAGAPELGTQLGKRYGADGISIELLCTRPGQGTLAANGVPLSVRSSRALPASD